MYGLFAGMSTLDVIHLLGERPDPHRKYTSTGFQMSAGGPAANAAVTFAALSLTRPDHGRAASVVSRGDAGQALPAVQGASGAAAPAASHQGEPIPNVPGAHGPNADKPGQASWDENAETNGQGRALAVLLTALGTDMPDQIVRADLRKHGVQVLDAGQQSQVGISSVVEHPDGRLVASTNAHSTLDVQAARAHLTHAVSVNGMPAVVLIDGHYPQLADLAVRLGTPTFDREDTSDDPFAELEAKPQHLRVLDGGSWKPALMSLLPFVDVAVISADFVPPVLDADQARQEPGLIADFLHGLGVDRVVRTDGAKPVRWWWDGVEGAAPVPQTAAVSTSGAGDVFHGAFAWALATGGSDLDPEVLVRAANQVAALSVATLGTRTFLEQLGALDLAI